MLQLDADGSQVVLEQAGVYEIQFVAFYKQKRPCVQLRVNSKAIFSSIDNQQAMIFHELDKHLNLVGYIKVGAQSKLAISVQEN